MCDLESSFKVTSSRLPILQRLVELNVFPLAVGAALLEFPLRAVHNQSLCNCQTHESESAIGSEGGEGDVWKKGSKRVEVEVGGE